MGNYLYNLTYGITNTYITSITNPITTLSNLTIDNSDGFIINIFVNSNLHAFDTTSNKNTMESITNLLLETNATLVYSKNNNFIALYQSKIIQPKLRSNVIVEIISNLSSEITFLICKNSLQCLSFISIDVKIIDGTYQELMNVIREKIISNEFQGELVNYKKLTILNCRI